MGKRKAVRLQDVAREAEISVSATSMALADHPRISDSTKQRVREICRRLGYRRPRDVSTLARRTDRARRIGMLFVSVNVSSEVHVADLSALAKLTQELGLRFELGAVPEGAPAATILDSAERFARGVSGLLLTNLVDQPLLVALERRGTPCVVVGHVLHRPSDLPRQVGQTVSYDDEGMGRLATAWLFRQGCHRVAFACEIAPPGLTHARWLAGYRLAHLDQQCTPDPQLVHIAGRPYAGGDDAAEHLLGLKTPPDGLVIPDVRIADEILSALRRRGCDMPARRVVIAGLPEIAQRRRLGRFPLIVPDIAAMFRMAVDLLQRRLDRRGHADDPIDVMVPFQTHNFEN